MELGIYTFAELTASQISPRQRLRDLLEEIELADGLGLGVFGAANTTGPTSRSRHPQSCSPPRPSGRRRSA